MRLVVVAACALLVGLVVGAAGATTGGARAQPQSPPGPYEYRIEVSEAKFKIVASEGNYPKGIIREDNGWQKDAERINWLFDGWEVFQVQTWVAETVCRPEPIDNEGSVEHCSNAESRAYVLRRPRQ